MFDYVVTWHVGSEFSDPKEAQSSDAGAGSVQSHLQARYAYRKNVWVKTTHRSLSIVTGQWNETALEDVRSEQFRGSYPYMSIFPKVFLSLR